MTTELTPWRITEDDLARWKGIKRKILQRLAWRSSYEDRYVPISREELEAAAGGAINPATRISELRKAGYVIKCLRGQGNDTYYQLLGYTGEDNTQGRHCRTCTCGRA